MSGDDGDEAITIRELDAFARTSARLEAVGVAMCGEPFRRLFSRDRGQAVRALIARIEAERLMCEAFEARAAMRVERPA